MCQQLKVMIVTWSLVLVGRYGESSAMLSHGVLIWSSFSSRELNIVVDFVPNLQVRNAVIIVGEYKRQKSVVRSSGVGDSKEPKSARPVSGCKGRKGSIQRY